MALFLARILLEKDHRLIRKMCRSVGFLKCTDFIALVFVLITFSGSSVTFAGDFASAELVSEVHGFRASVQSDVSPIELNRIHQWQLTLTNAEGQPVENARIAVSGGMPAHNHGLPTAPRVTQELSPGVYLVEGMKFQMGGSWIVNFKISAQQLTDTVTFELSL